MTVSAKNLDFSGVKDRGAFNPRRVAEGDYRAKIVKVEDSPTKESGKDQWVFTIKLAKFSQNSYPYRCQLEANTLWKIRNLAIAAGVNVPKKRVKVNPNKLVGRDIGVTMEDDEYEGRPKSEIAAVFPVNELTEGTYEASDDEDTDDEVQLAGIADGDEDEAPAKTKKAKGKSGKKKKGKKGEASDMEELDLSDL